MVEVPVPADALALIEAHIADGRWADGEAMARRVLDVFPYHCPVLLALGTILEHTGREDEALAIYERAIAVNPVSVATCGRNVNRRRKRAR